MNSKRTVRIMTGLLLSALAGNTQTTVGLLNAYFTQLVQTRQFTGNVLVAEKGKVVYMQSFGKTGITTGVPNTRGISFPVASVSKTFTATAILQLAEKGRLQVSDPVSRYLPAFPYTTVTIKHLLSHTSGLPPYDDYFKPVGDTGFEKSVTNADYLAAVEASSIPLAYQPGDNGNYDNVNFLVLSLIVERVSGLSYNNYIQRYILKPAGMKHTRFIPLTVQYTSDSISSFVYPYTYLHMYDEAPVMAAEVPFIRAYWRTFALNGFGDYVSTVDDLLQYDKALYENRLLKRETLQMALTPVLMNDGKPNEANFGLGWELEKDTTLGCVPYHGGSATGLSCVLIRNITRHQTVILFDNGDYRAHEIGWHVLELINGREVETPRINLARIYGIALVKEGPAKARQLLDSLRKDSAVYTLQEGDMNSLGYEFLGSVNVYHLTEGRKFGEALETFRISTELFPQSWNCWDSYGEALLAMGKKEEAVAMYRRSVELNPANDNGRKVVEELSGKPH